MAVTVNQTVGESSESGLSFRPSTPTVFSPRGTFIPEGPNEGLGMKTESEGKEKVGFLLLRGTLHDRVEAPFSLSSAS